MAKTLGQFKEILLQPPKPYYPSLPETREWYAFLNRRIFGTKLPKKVQFELRELKEAYAQCIWDENNKVSFKIELLPRFKNARSYIEALAHEMVHVAQVVECGEMNHGPTFYKWRPILETNYLNLNKKD